MDSLDRAQIKEQNERAGLIARARKKAAELRMELLAAFSCCEVEKKECEECDQPINPTFLARRPNALICAKCVNDLEFSNAPRDQRLNLGILPNDLE